MRLFTNLLIIFDEHFSSRSPLSLDRLNNVSYGFVKLGVGVKLREADSYHLLFLGGGGRSWRALVAFFDRGLHLQDQLQLGALSHLVDRNDCIVTYALSLNAEEDVALVLLREVGYALLTYIFAEVLDMLQDRLKQYLSFPMEIHWVVSDHLLGAVLV